MLGMSLDHNDQFKLELLKNQHKFSLNLDWSRIKKIKTEQGLSQDQQGL